MVGSIIALVFRKNWKWIAAAFIVAAIITSIHLTVQHYKKVIAERNMYQQAAVRWEGYARGWKQAYDIIDTMRNQEHNVAVDAVEAERQQCDARIARVRNNTRIIREVVTREVPVDANNCPVRSVIDADSLRNIFQ